MSRDFRALVDYLHELGVEGIGHSGKTYLAHLVNVYRFMERHGCTEELCRAGMFHSIYGTQQFQGFKLELERRPEVRDLIGARAERLAYLNCALDRPTLDEVLEQGSGPLRVRDRISGEEVALSPEDFDDLCRIHLHDWLEQVPRSRFGWGYRREAYRRMAERLGGQALEAYDSIFAQEPCAAGE